MLEHTACSRGCTRRTRILTHFGGVICALCSMGEKWLVAEGDCCCTTSPFSFSNLTTKADEGQLLLRNLTNLAVLYSS